MEVAGMSDVAASVRLLGRDDVAPMRSMLAMFGEAFDEGRAYSDRPPGAAWLQRLLGSDAFIALAAMKDDEMVGGVRAARPCCWVLVPSWRVRACPVLPLRSACWAAMTWLLGARCWRCSAGRSTRAAPTPTARPVQPGCSGCSAATPSSPSPR